MRQASDNARRRLCSEQTLPRSPKRTINTNAKMCRAGEARGALTEPHPSTIHAKPLRRRANEKNRGLARARALLHVCRALSHQRN